MTFDLPNLIAGAFLGFIVGLASTRAYVEYEKHSLRQKLKKAYGHLAGDYVNFRVKDDGREEPTGGSIRLIWLQEGSFRVQGLHANGVAQWESVIRMSLEFTGTGTGHYRHVQQPEDIGTQQVTYLPETRCFVVMGASSIGNEFLHHWRRIET